MRRYLPLILILIVAGAASSIGLYYFNQYWIHRYDELITRQAKVYSLDEKLVWSVIYEETYFRAWKIGGAEEIGLMQVTPTVARIWAKETGFQEFEKQSEIMDMKEEMMNDAMDDAMEDDDESQSLLTTRAYATVAVGSMRAASCRPGRTCRACWTGTCTTPRL